MKRGLSALIGLLAGVSAAWPQGRPADWPLFGGDAQRTGWEKSDFRITKENVKDFQLVMKHKLDNQRSGPRALTPPAVIGMLISYRGFKELAFVAGSDDNLWAIDADLDRVFWKKHFTAAGGRSRISACAGAASPSLVPPPNFASARPGPAAEKPTLAFLSPAHFGEPRPVFTVSADGKLHILNTANGEDLIAPMPFLTAGLRPSSLTIANGVLYTTTTGGCGHAPDAVWAIDMNRASPAQAATVAHYEIPGGGLPAVGGIALSSDGTVYAQTPGALTALSAGELKMKQSFALPGAAAVRTAATPTIFRYKDRELIAAAGGDGRISLWDGEQKTLLSQTPPIGAAGTSIWGGLATWEDTAGTRWVAAPVWGPVSAEFAKLASGTATTHGAIVAFRLDEHDGKPMLTPAWISRDMPSPEPPVITADTVFALSAGEYSRDGKPKSGSHATFYALDGATGREVYSSGSQVTAPGELTGIAIANARVYFTTTDNTLYAFGIFLER